MRSWSDHIKVSGHILTQALPLILSQIGHNLMTLTDNVMVGRLGPKPLAALAVAHTLYVFFFLLALGLLSTLRTFVAEARAKGIPQDVGIYMRQGLFLCLPLCLLCAAGFYVSKSVFTFFGQPLELIPYAQKYLGVLIWGMPFIYGFVCLRQINEGLSESRPSMWLVLMGALINIPLNYALIHGNWGFPKMGIQGAALSTITLSAIIFFILLLYLYRNQNYKVYKLFAPFSFSQLYRMKDVILIGVPMAGTRLGEVGFFLSMALLMGSMGTMVLAGHQIAIVAASFTFMIPLGLSFALTVLIADAKGRESLSDVKHIGWLGFSLGALLMVPSGIIFTLFPDMIAKLYTDKEILIRSTRDMIRIAGVFQIFDGVQIVGVGILQGLKDTSVPFINILFSFWCVGLPLCYVLGVQKHLQGVGVWTGALVALSLVSVLHIFRFKYILKKLEHHF